MVKGNDMHISRVTRSIEAARVSYNRLSRWYDLLAGTSEQAATKDGLRMLKAKAGETILEIGFGTGHCLLALAELVGASGHIHGIDLSEGMLTIAKSRIEHAGFVNRVELRCWNAAKLPYKIVSLDAIFSSFTLELFDTPEIPVVLRECWRVLKHEGRICIVSLSREGKPKLMTRLYDWAHEKFPSTVDCRPIYVRQALYDAGFKVGQFVYRSMWDLPVEVAIGIKA